ncbi:IS3 family transposase [Bacteroidota bacterium]
MKKSCGHLLKSKAVKFRFIFEHIGKFKVEKMCQTLEVTRSGYHNYVKRRITQRKVENAILLKMIKDIWENSYRLYGSPRIHAELRFQGIKYNRKRIERLMRKNGIAAKTKRKYKVTTDSYHKKVIAENLLGQKFSVAEPNRVWASDITYIGTKEGWLYLAVIMDLYSRMIVGWAMSERINKELVLRALNQAIIRRNPAEGLIFHSDRGSQYCSDEVVSTLSAKDIAQSMSGKDNCYDNAVVESFFHTLKTELVNFQCYKTRSEARFNIFEYIEVFYNKIRRHSSINYLSPVYFENKINSLVA